MSIGLQRVRADEQTGEEIPQPAGSRRFYMKERGKVYEKENGQFDVVRVCRSGGCRLRRKQKFQESVQRRSSDYGDKCGV